MQAIAIPGGMTEKAGRASLLRQIVDYRFSA
jgi:hypothetical protein